MLCNMASTAPSGWSLLKTTSSKSKKQKQCPKLFYNFSASAKDGIKLLLTDLISLWRCSLPRSKIISSASEKHTSIDPSESTEQMKVFLDKLALALHSGTNKLAKDDNEDTNLRPLVLKSSIDLPKPLKPLEWTFTLWPQAASELAATILRPALHQLSMAQQKLDSVIEVVKDKDHVIERLLDRVAEKGVDMSLIFPTLTGTSKRGGSGVKVEEARKLVPGMKTFDRSAWEGGFKNNDLGEEAEAGLSKLVRGCEKCFVHSELDHAESMSSWVQKLPGAESLESGPSKSVISRSQSQSQSQRRGDKDTESESEFETQATPPHIKKRPSPEAADDDTSDSDSRRKAKRARTGATKLGALGRSSRSKSKSRTPVPREESSSPVPPTKAHSPPKRKVSDASSATETASEGDDEPKPGVLTQSHSKISRVSGVGKSFLTSKSPQPQKSPSPQSRPPRADSNVSAPSRRLGRIGQARHRTGTASPVPERAANGQGNHNDLQEKRPSEPATPSRQLGRLGMRNANKQASQAEKEATNTPPSSRTRRQTSPSPKQKEVVDESDATASPSPSPSPRRSNEKPRTSQARQPNIKHKDGASPARSSSSDQDKDQAQAEKEEAREPETEEQRAARRREELKRTIQTSGPKKKRRF